ncbi:MAG: hypothetical protein GY950_27350, partial [bacterium]|nr:hypothetical protein [bacterium]
RNVTWFALNDGLIRYDTSVKKDYGKPFQTLIRQIATGEKVIFNGLHPLPLTGYVSHGVSDSSSHNEPGKHAVRISYKNRKLRFHVAAPFFEKESALLYSYFLEGFDRSWSQWTPVAEKDYINLHGGAYRFRVKAKNIYDHESLEAVFPFRILTPWYITWWAVSFYLLLLGFLFYRTVK